MTRDEYERRKRRLDEDRRAAMELIEASYRQQLKALEIVWATTSGEAGSLPASPAWAPLQDEPVASPPPPPPPPAVPSRPPVRSPGALYNEVWAALRQVPEVFTRHDVLRALGHSPDRGTLFRTLQELVKDGYIAVETIGTGKRPGTYRKAAAAPA